jgi:nucleoside-diphosphate-sugar epimerase
LAPIATYTNRMISRKETILVTGACGQLGTELVEELRKIYGTNQVIASDTNDTKLEVVQAGPFEKLNVLDKPRLGELVEKYHPTQIYHLAAILSAAAERNPALAWDVNIAGFMHVMDAAREASQKVFKVYSPSSIAVFGPNTPKENTPQHTITDPTTVYGITKLVGERLAEYYFTHYGLDVRSIRYPGLISYKTPPGGGTTDYAVDIFYQVIKNKAYTSFLGPETRLPMMYMPDALRGTLELMETDSDRIKIRSSYNLTAMSFNPRELANEIQNQFGAFEMRYEPDFRQGIADSWPNSIDDQAARTDWGWKPKFELPEMVADMLKNIPAMQGA